MFENFLEEKSRVNGPLAKLDSLWTVSSVFVLFFKF